MSGNGRGNMRPTSRSPPFLVVGLLVAMCILAFNYWTVSSKNGELVRQMEGLQVDLRAVSDKHLTVEKRAADLASQLSELQSKGSQLQSSLAEKDHKVVDLSSEVENLKSQLQKATESMQKGQTDTQRLQEEKQSLQAELEKVKGELSELQKAPVNCDKNACKDVIRELVSTMTTHIGKPAVAGALKDKPEVMQISKDLLEGADQPQQQQQQQPQQQPQNPAEAQQKQNQGREQAAGNQPAAQGAQAAAQVVGQDPNVVQMQQQQQPGAAEGLAFHQQALGGGVGFGNNDVLIGGQEQPPRDNMVDLPKQMDALNKGQPALGPDGKAPEIVPQNLPRPGSDEGALNALNPNNLNDPNVPAAQEDVADNHHLDLPEDEMDKQAAANHGAEDMANLGNDLHDQLQDLSKNDRAVDQVKQPLVDDDEAQDMEGDPDAKPRQAGDMADKDDDLDYDDHDQRRMEVKQGGEKADEQPSKDEKKDENKDQGKKEETGQEKKDYQKVKKEETKSGEETTTGSDVQNQNLEGAEQGVAHMAVQGQGQRESEAVSMPASGYTVNPQQQQEGEGAGPGEKDEEGDGPGDKGGEGDNDGDGVQAVGVNRGADDNEETKEPTTSSAAATEGVDAKRSQTEDGEDEEETRTTPDRSAVDGDAVPVGRAQEDQGADVQQL